MSDDKPTFAELIDWVEGRLDDDAAEEIADYVAKDDETTRADVAWIRAFLAASESMTLERPPARVREVLRRRFESYAETRQSPGFFRRIIATLTFDSGRRPAVAGIRSAATEGMQRQFIFTTDIAEVALNVQPRMDDDRIDIVGQVFASDEVALEELSIQLLQEQTGVGLTSADELGEFTLNAVPTGDYKLIVSAEQFEIVLQPVHLQI